MEEEEKKHLLDCRYLRMAHIWAENVLETRSSKS